MFKKCNIDIQGNLEQKIVNHLHTRRRTSREFRLNANIGDFNMGDFILDLGSEVNVIPKKTWQCMGYPTLGYSPIQLKLANQHRVFPIGMLKGVTVDLDGVHTKDDFKVIEIVDGTTPCMEFLGLDWVFYNYTIINLKMRKMTFDSVQIRCTTRSIRSIKLRRTYFLRPGGNQSVIQNNCARRILCESNCRWGNQLEKRHVMHVRLRYRVVELAIEIT